MTVDCAGPNEKESLANRLMKELIFYSNYPMQEGAPLAGDNASCTAV